MDIDQQLTRARDFLARCEQALAEDPSDNQTRCARAWGEQVLRDLLDMAATGREALPSAQGEAAA